MKKCNVNYLNITQNVIYYSNSVTCNLLLQCPGRGIRSHFVSLGGIFRVFFIWHCSGNIKILIQ